jgi:hypothetical protein
MSCLSCTIDSSLLPYRVICRVPSYSCRLTQTTHNLARSCVIVVWPNGQLEYRQDNVGSLLSASEVHAMVHLVNFSYDKSLAKHCWRLRKILTWPWRNRRIFLNFVHSFYEDGDATRTYVVGKTIWDQRQKTTQPMQDNSDDSVNTWHIHDNNSTGFWVVVVNNYLLSSLSTLDVPLSLLAWLSFQLPVLFPIPKSKIETIV